MPLTVDLLAGRRAVVFDAYGTLFDVHAAVARHAAAVGPDAARLSEIWRAKQLEYSWVLSLAGRYEPFWTLTERALDHAFARCPAVDRALREPLLDAYRTLDAFPDAAATLARPARARLSHRHPLERQPGDARERRPIGGSRAAPRRGALGRRRRRVQDEPAHLRPRHRGARLRPEEVVFVSSNRWDVAGAAAFGFSAVWVNRAGLPEEYAELPPAAVVADLAGILGL